MRIGLRDPVTQRFFPITDGRALIGSSSHCQIVLDHGPVAPEHARVRVGAIGVEIDDLATVHGTFVNGVRIDKHFLGPRDEVRFGEVVLLVEVSAEGGERKVAVCRRCGAEVDPSKTRRLTREGVSDETEGRRPLCDTCERRRAGQAPAVLGLSSSPSPATPLDPAASPRPAGSGGPGAAARPGPAFRLDGYETLGVIGAGSQAIVYKLRHPTRGVVAVKCLGVEHGKKARARFKREAEVLRRLAHPNLVTLIDTIDVPGTTAIVMEYVEGPSLAQLIERGPLPAGRVVRLGRQVADGLACAARAGVVHRDIKPSNILVAAADVAKLTDFGLASWDEEQEGTRLTVEGQWLGTPHYMAPEQVEGKQVDPRTDVYGLGTTLFHALTGILPFTGRTPGELFRRILSDPPPLQAVEARAGAAARALFERMLAKRPEERPDAAELVGLLDQLQIALR